MKTLSIKSFLFSLVVVLNCAFVSAQGENNFIYDTKYENDVMVSKTVFERNEDTNGLNPKTKYEYKYDPQGRISEKIAYKWSAKEGKWINNFIMTCVYDNESSVKVEYAQWNIKTKKYNQNVQTHEYSLSEAQQILAKK